MGNFAENLNLGNRFRPPVLKQGGGRKRSVSHPGVTIWWPIYISRGFSARPLNVK